jgi:hypothetical protein
MKLNGAHQLLVYVDDVNVLGDNTVAIKTTEIVIDTSKEVCLEVSAEKTKKSITKNTKRS